MSLKKSQQSKGSNDHQTQIPQQLAHQVHPFNPGAFAGKEATQPLVENTRKTNRKCCKIAIVALLCGAVIALSITLPMLLSKEEHGSTASSHHLCMWNATNLSIVNGLYSSQGTSQSGYPMYALPVANESCYIDGDSDTEHDALYLFNSMQSIWSISWIADNAATPALQGICASNTITNITECNGLWQIPRGKPQSDVMVFHDECPAVSCKGIQVSYDAFVTNESCIGIFGNRIDDNLYQKGTSDLFLFFNPTLFRWACGSRSEATGCVELDALTSSAVQQSWYNAHRLRLEGESISMLWSNGHRATLQCIQTAPPSQSPTDAPTASPTEAPTDSPTKAPTPSPTPSPTESPTASPTEAPTQSPTASPTPAPTKDEGHRMTPSNLYTWLLISSCVFVCV